MGYGQNAPSCDPLIQEMHLFILNGDEQSQMQISSSIVLF